jgi:hypothetical protein
MALDEGLDEFPALLEADKSAVLVGTHQLAVTDDVSTENGSQLAFDSVCHDRLGKPIVAPGRLIAAV